MKSLARIAFAILASTTLAASFAAGCGSDKTSTAGTTNTGGSGTGTAGGNTTSTMSGTAGGTSTSTSSSTTSGTGGSMNCLNLGAVCAMAADCCSGACTNGICNLPACTSDNQVCAKDADCCSGTCASGKCAPLNTTCSTLNNTCATNNDCCSGLCSGGKCSASSFCVQTGDICSKGTDCCSGVCNKANDAGVGFGTCGPTPSGSANCQLTDGMLCAGTSADGGVVYLDGGLPACGGGCCSRLCAPYGPTGTLICQPASGCHVVGDLCTKDTDCCGSAGLPGGSGQPVTCDIAPGAAVGVCRNPMGCKPDGAVCRTADMSCNASCDCCAGNCNQQPDVCRLDNLGVPRCAALKCVDPGGACASSANCCNNVPCVPNPVDGGTPPYICYQGSCVPKCGTCTVDADCCPGSACLVPIGSTMGTCGPCTPPPPDGGVPDSGTPDSGTPDSGTPDSGTPDGGPVCSLYGQQCMTDGDCCNGVPCNSANGPCQPGVTGCTCHYLIK